ncbi:MAG: GHKL domain-containing protein [Clostridia bacterium]|nr:GHKL domain-containing protein [Clostridia bacterium]
MEKLKNSFKSIQVKLFFTLCISVIITIILLIIVNNFILETFFLYNKKKTLKIASEQINNLYNSNYSQTQIEDSLNKIEIANNYEILIKGQEGTVYTSEKNFFSNFEQMAKRASIYTNKDKNIIELGDNSIIRIMTEDKTNISYLFLAAELDNENELYIRTPISFIRESVEISNRFLYTMAFFVIIVAAIIVSFVSKKFTKPIVELDTIAKKMSNLDFSTKYQETDTGDEINNLGKSINIMSDKLEKTINTLRNNNLELERDIEEKSKIDEMRKSFISDVSHELKTPIALIQGYSEGLIENINKDEESRKFYAEVIQDEAEKMDKLVKQLLELMNLEYGEREFNNKSFNIVELEKEVLRKLDVMIQDKKIEAILDTNEEINVFADDFYIEQVITNYVTNAIKNTKDINGEKYIKILNEIDNDNKTVSIKVFNTGENIKDEDSRRLWNRFYKSDKSRKREDGSTGIGLSIVKAIMNNYKKGFGFNNKINGVEFYFELDLTKE